MNFWYIFFAFFLMFKLLTVTVKLFWLFCVVFDFFCFLNIYCLIQSTCFYYIISIVSFSLIFATNMSYLSIRLVNDFNDINNIKLLNFVVFAFIFWFCFFLFSLLYGNRFAFFFLGSLRWVCEQR